MFSLPQHKKPIGLFNLPKLRHKSTHIQKNHLSKSPERHNSQKQKTSSHYFQSPKHAKFLSKIEKSLSLRRYQFRELTNINDSLLSKTFFKFDLNKKTIEEKKKLQKRKVYTMDKQEVFSRNHKKINNIVAKNVASFDDENQAEKLYTRSNAAMDYKIEMSWLHHCCYDGIFSISRTGATLSFKENTLYLFGGYGDSLQTNLLFHNFILSSNEWHHIKSFGEKPMLSLMYHTCNLYKDFLVFIGGFSLSKTQLKKFPNFHINIFNLSTNNWAQFNWGHYIKHHATCMIGNVLFIHGGINERETTQNTLYMIHLNFSNLLFSKVISFSSSQALSHHQIITTINDENRLRMNFSIDGLIIFGGKRDNEKLSNELYCLETSKLRLNSDETSQTKNWQLISVKGSKPEPRMCHTFDLLQNKGICVLVGGINENNQYLNDMWIFDLFRLNWTKIEDVPLLKQTGGIAYHSSAVNQSVIYIYGGITKNKTEKQFYLIQAKKFQRQLAKQSSRRKNQLSSHTLSFKGIQLNQ